MKASLIFVCELRYQEALCSNGIFKSAIQERADFFYLLHGTLTEKSRQSGQINTFIDLLTLESDSVWINTQANEAACENHTN